MRELSFREKRDIARYANAHGAVKAAMRFSVSAGDVMDWQSQLDYRDPSGTTRFVVREAVEVPRARMLTIACEQCGHVMHVLKGEAVPHCPRCQRRSEGCGT